MLWQCLNFVLGAVTMRMETNLLHSQWCKLWARKYAFCVLCHKLIIRYLNWLDVLNSNERRTWGASVENWTTSTSFCYLEEDEEKTSVPNIVKDDLYVRKLSPIMPNPGNTFDQFLPKCWIPEDVNWKRIKRETYKPWYKEFQGFRFVFTPVSVSPVFTQCPGWMCSLCAF